MNFRDRPFVRMQEKGAFSTILEDLVRSLPGCIAAAFVDQEGEAVDAVGWADEFDIKVAGAHLRIMLEVAQSSHCGSPQDLLISATRLSYRVRALAEGYALVLLCSRDSAFILSPRTMDATIHALSKEAGFPIHGKPAWFPVEVVTQGERTNKPRRARAQGGDWLDVDVLGALVGLAHRERGYRVRLTNGHEVTLLREPLGRWWSDAPLA